MTGGVRGALAYARRLFVGAGDDSVIVNGLTVVALAAALSGASTASLVLVLLATAVILILGVRHLRRPGLRSLVRPTGTYVPARALLPLAALAAVASGEFRPLAVVGVSLVGIAALLERYVVAFEARAIPVTQNLQGSKAVPSPRVPVWGVFVLNAAAYLLDFVLAACRAPEWIMLAVGVLALVGVAVVAVDALTRLRTRYRAERGLTKALEDYSPSFLLHWDAPSGTAYQVGMWLPYLERIGLPFAILVRNRNTFLEVTAITTAPVVMRTRLEDLDSVMVPSIKAVFYVNTATKNAHLVRYTTRKHIQLNHGDSDKAPSYNPVFRMYDRNFVAGQAAIDRFARHGVEVPESAFEIVGRPQVESIAVDRVPIGMKTPLTVLYAPTWAGFYKDANYSSLEIAYPIVELLLERGVRVVFRAHPYTRRTPALVAERARIIELLRSDRTRTGLAHVFGDEAEVEWDIVRCFNAADALIADISSVVPDFLFSEKPFAIADMRADGDVESFVEANPIAEAAYVFGRDRAGFAPMLTSLLKTDPKAELRSRLKSYYLGDFADGDYARHFLEAARRYL